MKETAMRRQQILEVLSERRFDTRMNLANEFNVDEKTIRRDIEVLSCSAPIFCIPGRGGGVRIADGWYYSRRYLRDDQEELLRILYKNLSAKRKKTMQSILDAFARPKAE